MTAGCARIILFFNSLFEITAGFASKLCPAGQGKQAASDFMGGFGLGSVVEQLADLKLGELLDSPPPGFDEAVAISKARGLVLF